MTPEVYQKTVDSMTWSYSRLRCFDDCKYRWFQKYILNEEEEPLFYSSFGKFMHELIERFYVDGVSNDELVYDFLMLFPYKVLGDRPKESIVQKCIKSGMDYLRSMQPLPYSVIAIEDKIEFKMAGKPFVAYVDFIGEKDGELVIVDHKSRSLKQRSTRKKPTQNDVEIDDMLKQLYIYSYAVYTKYDRFPKWLALNCFKTGTLIEEEFDYIKYKDAILWVQKSIKDIREESHFSPDIDYFKCTFLCGFRESCCYFEMSK